jgi:adenylate cyclase
MLLALTVSAVMVSAFLITGDLGLPLRLEGETLDLRFRLRPPHVPPVSLVIVDIDDPSITEIGRWPWSRQVLARLLDRIIVTGPQSDLPRSSVHRAAAFTARGANERRRSGDGSAAARTQFGREASLRGDLV